MRIGLAQSLAVFVGIASGCATAHTTGGPDAPVQLQVPEVLAWEPEGPFDLKFAISNGTQMTFFIAEPKVEASDVTVYGLDGTVVCRTPRAVQKVYEKWAVKQLFPGKHWELQRDLRKDCPHLGPGTYRYEANYRANSAENATNSLYQAVLGPQGGKVLVREGATAMKYEELVAEVAKPATPAASAAEPAAGGAEPAAAGAAEPAAGAQPAAAAEPMPSAAEIRACVDKELRDRGLNAYGDPQGTHYDNGTPVEESGRILYVASRNAAIRRACKIPMF